MRLLVDDIRDLEGMDIICRTARAGIAVAKQIDITELYLDHDLGSSITGYDVVKVLINCKRYIPFIQIVSSNPVGRDNIAAELVSAGYTMALNGINFTK